MRVDAFFLPVPSGQRFCLLYEPDDSAVRRGAVVYVHPFAEEMNKSRRMAAMQAKAMASAGYSVLQVDLHGCGDSSGDFGDASWENWIDDVRLACNWFQKRGDSTLWLWGLRTGCLLACEAAARIATPIQLLMWQPVVSGKQYLQQFLRLKIAGEMLGGENKGLMLLLREQLARGDSVEVAGYCLSSGVVSGLERAELAVPEGVGRIEWLELSAQLNGTLSPSACARLAKLQSPGRIARGTSVHGPAFWQTAEIAECPALIEASLLALSGREQM